MEIIEHSDNIIYKIKNIINDYLSKIDNTGYMKAFILGDKNNIDSDMYLRYQKIGVTHLFALSGSHVTVLTTILFLVLRKFNMVSKYLIVNIVLIIYGFIVGFPASIKRCIIFYLINSINKIFKLNISSIKVLFLVISLLIIYNYKIIYDVGFIYSVVTVMGIILCGDYISCDNKLFSSFRLSLVAFIFSLPISLIYFYDVNIMSVIYNMFYVPYISFIVYPLCLLSFIVPVLSNILNVFIYLLEYVSIYLSDINLFNIYLDFNILEIILFYTVTLLVFYKRVYKLIVLLIIIVIVDLLVPYLDSKGYIYFFDVGQGDSCLVISPYRKDIVLIDTGGLESYVKEKWMVKGEYYVTDNVISFMKSKGIKSIDLLILSHGDSDHAKEVSNIYNSIDIKYLKLNRGDLTKYESISKYLINTCDYKPDNMVLKYLDYKDYGNENDNSLFVYMKIYDKEILSYGDASKYVEEDIINKYKLSNIDILKVGHHGSKTSSSKLFIDKIKPKYSVISVGKNNRFGHPNGEVLDVLKDSTIYRTDIDGTIEFIINNDKFKVNTFSP